jgi:hypothetical protein
MSFLSVVEKTRDREMQEGIFILYEKWHREVANEILEKYWLFTYGITHKHKK